jgi:hypothetical protein
MMTWTVPGRFRERGRSTIGSIVNLSAAGAGIVAETEQPPVAGTVVRLSLTGWTATATVRHVRLDRDRVGANYFGLEFSQLDPEFRDFVMQYLAAFLQFVEPDA